MIETQALRVAYGATTVLDGVDFQAVPGSVTAIVGPNGAGKSTLLKAIAGLVPASGTLRRPAGSVGYLPQEHGARAVLTVLEVVLLGRLGSLGLAVTRADLAAAIATLDDLGLARLANRYLDELSGGQRQMVYLAQVLAARPSVLLLDEPTGALDLRNQMEMLDQVRRLTRTRGIVTLVAIHDLNAAARYADRIALLQAGRLLALGVPSHVLTPACLAAIYRIEADIAPGPDGLPRITPLRPC